MRAVPVPPICVTLARRYVADIAMSGEPMSRIQPIAKTSCTAARAQMSVPVGLP